jgi:hypothetical protein
MENPIEMHDLIDLGECFRKLCQAVARLHFVQLSGDSQDKTEASSGTQVEASRDG